MLAARPRVLLIIAFSASRIFLSASAVPAEDTAISYSTYDARYCIPAYVDRITLLLLLRPI